MKLRPDSKETVREIDQEVGCFIDTQTTQVRDLLTKLNPVLLEAAEKLMEEEVMTGDDLRALMDGGTVAERLLSGSWVHGPE